jgi:two-component system sensor histidine kinase RpfC
LRWANSRLRNRPDREHEITINRLALSGLALIYLLIANGFGSRSAANILHDAGTLLTLYYGASIALFGWILYQPGVSTVRRLIGMVLDFTFFSYCMHSGDEAMAPLFPIYLWAIFGNGFRFGVTYLALASACGVLSFMAVVLTTGFWHQHLAVSAGMAGGLVLLPLYVSSLIRKLSDAKRQAEEASRAKSAFLASVSHELRTPLNAVIGLADLLRGTRLDAEQKDMAQTIGQSGRGLLKLINTILDFSRIEAGRMPTKSEPFDLVDLVGDIRRMLGVQARAKGLRLALHITPHTPRRLVGDRNHLEEILTNLVGNAVKFTAAGQVLIAVDAVKSGECVRLRVEITDTGIGIAKEAQARIFESFTQANESIIDRFGGTGLGLAIVKQLVELHGGTIGVDSAPGRGSTFWFEIDSRPADEAIEAAPPRLQPMVLVSSDPDLPARLLPHLPGLQMTDDADMAADLLAALREDGIRQPVAILDAPGDTEAAAALARQVAGEDAGAASLILMQEPLPQELPPESLRGLFVTSLPRTCTADEIAAAMAIAEGSSTREMSDPLAAATEHAQAPLEILVADDNRINQKVMRKILERIGHEVAVADDGEAALEAMHERDFDLVLMDINMPVMNGIEATKLYRFGALGQRHVPIVALTADATPEIRVRCEAAGMDDCLTKPIEPARLVEIIERFRRPPADAARGDRGEAPGEDAAASMALDIPAIEANKVAELHRLGGAAFVDDLVQQFLDDSRDVLRELAAAVEAGDAHAFREQAHALRSGAANIGARGVYEMCLAWRQVDGAALKTNGASYVRALQREFERVRSATRPQAA